MKKQASEMLVKMFKNVCLPHSLGKMDGLLALMSMHDSHSLKNTFPFTNIIS